eukprot:1088745-Prymnesium_polylepis.1
MGRKRRLSRSQSARWWAILSSARALKIFSGSSWARWKKDLHMPTLTVRSIASASECRCHAYARQSI